MVAVGEFVEMMGVMRTEEILGNAGKLRENIFLEEAGQFGKF